MLSMPVSGISHTWLSNQPHVPSWLRTKGQEASLMALPNCSGSKTPRNQGTGWCILNNVMKLQYIEYNEI